MTTRSSRANLDARRVSRLITAIRTLPSRRLGSCIEEDEAARYAFGELDAERRDAVERHAESCAECAEGLDRIFVRREERNREKKLLSWLKGQIDVLAAPLRATARGLALPLALANEFSPAPLAQAFDTPRTFEGATPDGLLRWRCVTQTDDVVVSLETTVAELLLNPNVRLSWGDAVETVTFEERAGHIVAWAVFSKRQLADLTDEGVLCLELLQDGREIPA